MGNDFNRDEELERIINSDDADGLMVWINKNVSTNVGQRLDDKLFTIFLFNIRGGLEGVRPIYEASDMLTGMFLKSAYKCLGAVVREMTEYALFAPGKSYTLMENGIKVSGGSNTIGLMNSIAGLNRYDMEKWFSASKESWKGVFVRFKGGEGLKDSFGNQYGLKNIGELGTVRVGLMNMIPVLKCRQSEILIAAYLSDLVSSADVFWVMNKTTSFYDKARVHDATLSIIRSIEETKKLKSGYAFEIGKARLKAL